MQVWINGRFVSRDEAKTSVFDAGLQHGVGLFETMLARGGRLFRAEEHMRRLSESARHLRLSDRLRIDPLIEAVELTLARNGLREARVRLTITGGDLNLLQSRGEHPSDPTIFIVAQPPTEYPPEFFERGVSVVIADGRDSPLSLTAGHKTLHYWPRILALQVAAMRGAGEALHFTVSNHLCGGAVSNVVLVRDGEILTPIARGEEIPGALPSPVLPGITRAAILEIARSEAMVVQQRMLSIDDVLSADEVFLTNSSWGVLPVVQVERETIGDGAVGEVTQRLREAWLRLVELETAEA
jgi:branched-subunit amino acid aminotransferase/4-amino-4-deoxychorismate lyase